MDKYSKKQKFNRRNIVTLASVAGGGIAVAATAAPFLASFAPSRRAKGEGSAIKVDISGLQESKLTIVAWRRKPVWLLLRSSSMLKQLETELSDLVDPDSQSSKQPDYCKNGNRSIKPNIFIALGVCTHLGCSPGSNAPAGFLCACHGSAFDYAGRVLKGSPAPTNLVIPEHYYVDDTTVIIGESG